MFVDELVAPEEPPPAAAYVTQFAPSELVPNAAVEPSVEADVAGVIATHVRVPQCAPRAAARDCNACPCARSSARRSLMRSGEGYPSDGIPNSPYGLTEEAQHASPPPLSRAIEPWVADSP